MNITKLNREYAPRDLPQEVMDMLRRIEVYIAERGLDDLQNRFRDRRDPAAAYPSENRPSGIGGTTPINVIPNSGGPGFCCETVIAVAHGTRGQGGIGQVLRSLREHLISCPNPHAGLATKTAVLIYDVERRQLFWESKLDVNAHQRINGVQFVKCFWDGTALHVAQWT